MVPRYLKGIKNVIAAGMDKMEVPGLVIAVVQDGTVVYKDAFGYADKKNKIPMTTEHVLPIGSSTKAFTATAVAMLAAEGKLDLDSPLINYLPGFCLWDESATTRATARDILCHRTGLPRHDFMWIEWDVLTRQEILKRVKHLENNIAFRGGWQYQNMMYAVAGCLVEQVSGLSWEDFVQQRIFDVLKMQSANFNVEDSRKTELFPCLYMKGEGGDNHPCTPIVMDGISPAGGINANVGDAAKWVQFNLVGSSKSGQELLSKPYFDQLHQSNIPYKLLPFDYKGVVRQGYGLGWFIDSFRGEKMVDHGGNTNGATSLISFLPEKGIGCAILTNANSSHLPKALAYTIYDRFLVHGEKADWVGVVDEKVSGFRGMVGKAMADFKASGLGTPMSHKPEEYLGTYSHPAYGQVVLRLDEQSKLVIKYHQKEFALIHLHYDIFYFDIQEMPISVSAITGVDGQIQSLLIDLESSLPPIEFKIKER